MQTSEDWVGIEALVARYDVPKTWWYNRTRQKGPDRIPYLKIGRYCRFKLSEVDAWLEKQQMAGW